ncbi:hypothetical protein ACFYOK_00840 [Microbispora bryophytorum]|uniref:hypothetical protein n=1 Tax=Microbispora bryophytorum TaxID=1460882 RepID=UPI0033CEB09E
MDASASGVFPAEPALARREGFANAAITAAAAHRIAVHARAAAVEVWSATSPASHGPAVCPPAKIVVNAARVAV